MPEEVDVVEAVTAFMVVVSPTGTLGVYTDKMPMLNVIREATPMDVETYCAQLAREIGRLTQIRDIKSLLTNSEEPVSEKIAAALAKRHEGE